MRCTPLGLLLVALVGCRERPPPDGSGVLPAAVVVEPRSLALRPAEAAQLAAQVNDAVGQPIGGATILFETSDPGVVRVTPTGFASSTGAAGNAQIVVSSGARRAVVPVLVTPGDVTGIQKVSGDGQRGAVGAALEGAISVKAVDAYGNAVSGVGVHFSTPDGGSVRPANAATDGAGLVSAIWTLGPAPGAQRLSAALQSASSVAQVFTAAAQAGTPAKLAAVEQPGAAPVAAGAEVVVRARVTDAFGNAVPGAEVAWRARGDATVSLAASTTDVSGLAEARVKTAGAAGANRVEARAAGLAEALELSVTTVPGPPARIEIVRGDGQSARAHRVLKVNPAVRVVDAHGNALAGVPVRFAVTAGKGRIEVAAPMSSADGVASCGRWTLGSPGENAITAEVEGLAAPARLGALARP
jgi:hypothetical protein